MRQWLFLLIVLYSLVPASAIVMRHGDTVNISANQVINDDLLVSGGTVNVLGKVTGDVVAAGGTVNIEGSVGGSLFVTGGTVNVRGPVAGSLYAAAGTFDLRSSVGRNAAITGGTVTTGADSNIGRDLVIAGGSVTVGSTVGRNLQVSAGTLTVTSSARIGGDLRAVTNNANIEDGAVIQGKRIITQPVQKKEYKRGPSYWGLFLWNLFSSIALLITGLVFVSAAPRLTAQSANMLLRHPWASLLTGLIITLVFPFLFVLLLVFVVTIPLALILWSLYTIALIVSPVIVAVLIGLLVWRKPQGSLLVALTIGIGLLFVVRLLPVFGSFVMLIVFLGGLGALALAVQARSASPLFTTPEE